MQLTQFNVDVDPALKKKVKADAVEFEVNHGVIANTIFDEFFQRHPTPGARQRLYQRMKMKIDEQAGRERQEIAAAT